MLCPICREPRKHDEALFCTKCGADLSELESPLSARGNVSFQRALKQSMVLFFIGVLLIPVWMFIGSIAPAHDRLIESAPSTTDGEAIAWIAMWIAFTAAALRVVYAIAFERSAR